MDRNYHIMNNGELTRSENTIRFDKSDGNTVRIPVEKAEALFIYGQITFNTKLVNLLNDHNVEMHFFGWNDQYLGTWYPSKQHKSGQTIVAQVKAYDDEKSRLRIAKQIVEGSIHNMTRNLEYYNNRDRDISQQLNSVKRQQHVLHTQDSVEETLGIEATARKHYYDSFNSILDGFEFTKRSYHPPESEINALISYLNALTYASMTSAIHQTALDSTISYLHEPGDRRNSLALDLADVFKPVTADRTLFRLVNRTQVTKNDFRDDVDNYLLTDEAQQTVLEEYEKTLRKTVEHPNPNRSVSYKYLMRMEAYKLKKDLIGGENYDSFKRWW